MTVRMMGTRRGIAGSRHTRRGRYQSPSIMARLSFAARTAVSEFLPVAVTSVKTATIAGSFQQSQGRIPR